MKATPSKWDSDVFGVRVGRLRSPSPVDQAEVRKANAGLFDVVFVVCDGWHEPAGAVAMDWRYDMEASASPTAEPLPVFHPGADRTKEVVKVAETAFSDSRFLRDPRLAGKVGEFYRRWCLDAQLAGRLWATEDGNSPAFLVSGPTDPGRRGWRVELVAVPDEARGRGLCPRLISGVVAKLGLARRVRVSARNHRAIRSYESCGFRVDSVSTAWHVWMGEATWADI